MNLILSSTPASAASVAAPARILSAAGLSAGSAAGQPVTATSAAAESSSHGSYTTRAAVGGRDVEVPVSVNHRAREAYARATSVPLAVDPTTARTASATIASAKAGRGKLAVASQWDL
jgi:hypothetical protein